MLFKNIMSHRNIIFVNSIRSCTGLVKPERTGIPVQISGFERVAIMVGIYHNLRILQNSGRFQESGFRSSPTGIGTQ
jgi:hypothetical protein